jgi:hypothetical protein
MLPEAPKDRLRAALRAASRNESRALISSSTAFAVFDRFAAHPMTAPRSGRFLGMNRPPKQPARSEVAL